MNQDDGSKAVFTLPMGTYGKKWQRERAHIAVINPFDMMQQGIQIQQLYAAMDPFQIGPRLPPILSKGGGKPQ